MLQPPSAFDETTAIHMWLNQWIAKDDAIGAVLSGSNGRRASGRNRRYFLSVETGETEQLPSMLHPGETFTYSKKAYYRFTAANDEEAIEKGNARLIKEGHLKSIEEEAP